MGKSKELAELGDVVTQDSGNMLVGTTGHFNYSSGTTEITVGTDGTGSSAGGAVTFVSNNGATTLGYAGFQESEAAIGTMGSRALKLTTDNTARITVDASGRVTMPYQPAFMAFLNASHAQASGVALVGGTWNTRFNRGSYYSTSTRRFTAPVSGMYQFNCIVGTVGGTGSVSYFSAEVYVNGTRKYIGAWEGSGSSSYVGSSQSFVVELNQGDYAELGIETSKAVTLQHHVTSSGYVGTCFSGYLIG